MKSMLIQDAQVHIGVAPLVSPFRIATGQHDELENVFFCLQTTGGISGCGEAAVATHITGETIAQTSVTLQTAAEQLMWRSVTDPWQLISEFRPLFVGNHAGLAAFEMALLDAWCRLQQMPLWRLFSSPAGFRPQLSFNTDITVVIGDLVEAIETAQQFASRGFRAFKIKVGRDIELDLQRVLAVHRIAPDSTLILDANMGFTVDSMVLFLQRLNSAGVYPALLEQPVPKADWDGLRAITRAAAKNGTLVCADESVGSLADAEQAVALQAVSAINIKFMKTGIMESVQIAQLACQQGIKLMLGAMMESGLAITASAHFAAGMGCFDFHDLDTTFFIKGDYAYTPYLDTAGRFDLSAAGPGIGVVPPSA